MAILNDIQRMQAEGRTVQEIIASLKEKGISPREITEAITQSKIKEAVGTPEPLQVSGAPQYYEPPMPGTENAQQVQPSPSVEEIQPEGGYAPSEAQPQEPYQQYPAYQQPAQPSSQYQEYQPQAQGQGVIGISPDTITEISEQVVAEKLSPLRKDLEKVLDLKTTVESKLDFMDERLKRIEKIMDRLQLSILQKVGDYMTNIEDIKKEIIETQKSFKAISR